MQKKRKTYILCYVMLALCQEKYLSNVMWSCGNVTCDWHLYIIIPPSFPFFVSEFSQGAIDIYNCLQVVIQNCNFNNNGPADVIKQEQYRGHSAGLSIGKN